MTKPDPQIPALGGIRRKTVRASPSELVCGTAQLSHATFVWRIEPATAEVSLAEWAAENLSVIREKLKSHGAVLFRGFGVASQQQFQRVVAATGGDELMQYKYASTPRAALGNGIYTSTEYPADQFIPLHNEMSYSRIWPMKLWFYCAIRATHGGETPLADSRAVFRRISPAVSERFRTLGVQYIRNYGGSLDLSWQQVFATSSKAEVESFCQQAGIDWEWRDHQRLRTRQTCQAVITHPETGDCVWFNQAHIFHVSAIESSVRDVMLKNYSADELPRHAKFGDGSEIPAEELAEVRQAYEHESIPIAWECGDVLMLDNVLAAHGRRPFSGPRKILVAMAEPSSPGMPSQMANTSG